MEEGTINQWLKKEGDKVQKGEPLIVVETDKAAQEVEATADGVLARILHPEGAAVPVGTTIAIIAAEGEKVDASSLDGQGAQAKQAEQPAAAATSAPATTQSTPAAVATPAPATAASESRSRPSPARSPPSTDWISRSSAALPRRPHRDGRRAGSRSSAAGAQPRGRGAPAASIAEPIPAPAPSGVGTLVPLTRKRRVTRAHGTVGSHRSPA